MHIVRQNKNKIVYGITACVCPSVIRKHNTVPTINIPLQYGVTTTTKADTVQ